MSRNLYRLMKKSVYSLSILVGLSTNVIFSQESLSQFSGNKKLIQGHEFFHQSDYQLAYEAFKVAKVTAELDTWRQEYLLLCELYLNKSDADDKAVNYLENNPNTIQKSRLYVALGDYYFRNKNSRLAKKAFANVDLKTLTAEEEVAFQFKQGFLSFQEANYLEAKKKLIPIKNNKTYGVQVSYYLGNIALQEKDFDLALKYFSMIKEVPTYKKEVAYHSLVIMYKSKKYKEAITFGENIYQGFSKLDQQEIAKILGECYFYENNFKAAAIYLEQYPIHKKTNVDYYFLGLSYYKIDQYNKATQNFNQIVNGKDPLAQNAYYHLAACYLKQNLKAAALNAFKNAAEMENNEFIKEDALFNYAKLSYEIGNAIEPSTQVMQRFVEKYPNSVHAKSIESLITNAFLEFKDYKGIIDYYDKKGLTKDFSYQTALLEKGFEFYQENNLTNALDYFTKASALDINSKLKDRALFWKAEVEILLQNYKEAIIDLELLKNNKGNINIEELSDLDYNLGFAYFKEEQYDKALVVLSEYINNAKDQQKYNNALLRLADSYFAKKDFNKALENYNKIIFKNHPQSDYALFQKAMCLGYLGTFEQKKETLLVLQTQYQKSNYIDKSYFELGNLYVKNQDFKNAIDAFDTIILKYPNSSLVSKAMFKKATIFYNNAENLKALEIFKQIVAQYPGTSVAVQAVQNAKLVYEEIDDIGTYSQWVKTLDFINITDAQLDKTMFEAVEKKYSVGDYTATITSAKKYLSTYANGLYVPVVNFYLGQAYDLTNQKELSIEPFTKVVAVNATEYQEEVLNKLAGIYIQKQEWELAKPLLLSLEQGNYSMVSYVFAQNSLMKYYDVKKQYEESLLYAEKVLTNKESSDLLKLDAYLYGARAAFQLQKYDLSKKYYAVLEQQGKLAVKAEAQYYKANFLFINKNYAQSNIEAQKLPSQYQQYRFWGIKALMLMAQNYYELKDAYQANFILNSIVEKATDLPDLIAEAKKLLEKYQPKATTTVEPQELSLEVVK